MGIRQISMITAAVLVTLAVHGADYSAYKQEVLKMPGLIRFYSFEEGTGNEVKNLANADPTRRAITGGPFGSMTIIRPQPYGWRCLGKAGPDLNGPEWNFTGRFPDKYSLRSGTNDAMLDRSCICGREFKDGVTFALWFRTVPGEGHRTSSLIRLGNAYDNGFNFEIEHAPWQKAPGGRLSIVIAAKEKDKRPAVAIEGVESGVWHFASFSIGGGKIRLCMDDRTVEKEYDGNIISPITDAYPTAAKMNQVSFNHQGRAPGFLLFGAHWNEKATPNTFDLDEVLIFDRVLADNELNKIRTSGLPTDNAMAEKHPELSIWVKDDTSGYFRKGEPIPVKVRSLGATASPGALGHEGARALGHEGTRALGHEGTRALGHEGARALGHEGTRALGHEDCDVSPEAQMPNSPEAQMPNSPEAQMPKSPEAQEPNSPIAQEPNSPDALEYRAVVSIEQMQGAYHEKRKLDFKSGGNVETAFMPKDCGIYFIEVEVFDAKGKLLKRLDPMRTVAVTSPAPEGGLTKTNPIGLWAFNNDFSYDSPVRRMHIVGRRFWEKRPGPWNGSVEDTLRDFENRKKITPELRPFVCFSYPANNDREKLLSKMTPEERKDWEDYFRDVIETAKKINTYAFEFMSEPDCDRTTPESAAETIEYLCPILRKEMPEVKLVPAGACPTGLPWTDRMMAHGAWKHIDGISYHSYRGNPIMQMNLENPMKPMKAITDKYPDKKFEYWNTESGYDYLPRIGKRSMTAAEARAACYPVSQVYGYEMFTTSMPCAPEEEGAALQVHAILCEFALGFKSYAKCIAAGSAVSPSLQGCAWTALAGNVMNHMTEVRRLPLASLNMACFLVDQDDGSTIAAICGMKNEKLNFRLEPNKIYKSMNMLGDFGTVSTDANGILAVDAGMNPLYVFGVPKTMAESSVLKVELPKDLPEDGVMEGKIIVANEFGSLLEGEIVAVEAKGIGIEFGDGDNKRTTTRMKVEAGKNVEIPFVLKGTGLRNRAYVAAFELKNGEKTIAAVSVPFEAHGSITVIPQFDKAPESDEAWKDVPAAICDSLEDVSHGQPNLACLWLPHWMGKEDLSTSLKIGYVRDDALYFRLEVTDDVILPCPEDTTMPFLYDCLELFTDLRPVKEQGTTRSQGADQTTLAASDNTDYVSLRVNYWGRLNDKKYVTVTGTGHRTEKGYVINGRIAPTESAPFKVRPGSRLRMDFTINDSDTQKELRKAAITYHGSFNNYIRVDYWGKYELGL